MTPGWEEKLPRGAAGSAGAAGAAGWPAGWYKLRTSKMLKFLVFYLKWMVNRKLQNSEMLKFTVLLKQNWTGHNFGEWILLKK